MMVTCLFFSALQFRCPNPKVSDEAKGLTAFGTLERFRP